MGLFQNALAGSPSYKKAVTKWIPKAQNIEIKTKGRYVFSRNLGRAVKSQLVGQIIS